MSVARDIVGASPAIRDVVRQAERAGRTSETVLILGESGTGKELLAHKIHAASTRASGPFIDINCGALPAEVIESTLFGHVRGAFTGAIANQKGKFELADGGTLFLDEVGEASAAVQVKLLRALQERVIEPVGAQKTQKVNVRVVAATNRDLPAMIAARQFREDLYFRLEVLTIRLPPLRERREDIPVLVQHFLRRRAEGAAPVQIDAAALEQMARYAWPGNVRELENFVAKAVVSAEGGRITGADCARLLAAADRTTRRATNPAGLSLGGGPTLPAGTTVTRPAGLSGLAIAWWRFLPVPGDGGQPYACEVSALGHPQIQAVNFAGNRARVGRDGRQAEIALETGEVSRLHATVAASEEGFSIEDAGSRNGTFVDGRALSRGISAPLVTGTMIRIGKEWLGVAIELGPSGLRDVVLGPVLLAQAFARAGGDGSRSIDIRAVEAICAGRSASAGAELDGIVAALVGGKAAIIDEAAAREALPSKGGRPPALSMSVQELRAAVESFGGNKRKAARELGISHTTLHERLKAKD